jgi:hypothetical protein
VKEISQTHKNKYSPLYVESKKKLNAKKQRWTESVAQVVECFHSKYMTLTSIPIFPPNERR